VRKAGNHVFEWEDPYWTFPEPPADPVSDEPDPGEAGGGVSYRCLRVGCGWRGRGGAKAFDHHREAHHPIVNAAGHAQVFGCCMVRDQHEE
jgi:hypothetical protein